MIILFIQANGLSESIGLCNLSSFLKKHGHQSGLILLSHSKNVYKDIEDSRPDILGFSAFTGMHKDVFASAEEFKKNTGIPVIIGGPHTTFYPECIEDYPFIDYISSGEGEYSLLALLERLKVKGNTLDVPGISARGLDGKIYRNGISANIDDIQSMPIPDRDLYYKKYPFLAALPMKRFISGYGCPYDCTFCNEPWLRREMKIPNSRFVRKKSVEQVLEEISDIRSKYPLKRVHFSDDLFTFDIRWLAKFTEIYKKNFKIPYSCNLRFNLLNEATAALLKDGNCYAVQVGLESGSQNLRNIVLKKDISDEDIIKGAALLKKYGIKIYTTNIIGLPGETLEDALSTIRINHRIKADFFRINTLMPFPRTEIFDMAARQGQLVDKDVLIKDFSTEDSLHLFCKTDNANEFKNIAVLFFYMVKFPFLYGLFKRIIKRRHSAFIRMFGFINIIQDTLYFNISLLQGFRFFYNTILCSSTGTDLHWVPFKISVFQKLFSGLKCKRIQKTTANE
ncbi:MAG: radical SAM protein [Candidatus Omnitrophota bacterium]|nr:radical SAM protein [Candidatus Omnitrophota bacterium]